MVGRRQRKKDEVDAMHGRDLPGVALIDEGDLDRLAGHLPDHGGQRLHLGPLLLVRRGDVQHLQVADRVAPLHRLDPSSACAPLSGVLCTVQPSRMTAVSASARPSLQRNRARRSWTIASKQSLAIYRCVC